MGLTASQVVDLVVALGAGVIAAAIAIAVLRLLGFEIVVAVRRRTPLKRYPEQWEMIRSAILKRDHYRCMNCLSDDQLQVHHVVPLSIGGTNLPTNLITLCTECHARLHPHMRD